MNSQRKYSPGEQLIAQLFLCILAIVLGVLGFSRSTSLIWLLIFGVIGIFVSVYRYLNNPNIHPGIKIIKDNFWMPNADLMPPPPVAEERFPDLNETFTYEPETRNTPPDGDRYPNLDESFTYGTRRNTRRSPHSYPQQPAPEAPPPNILEVRGHSIYQHAFDAAQAVNPTLDKSQPLPIDIGLIVYRGKEKPAIYRTHDVPDDADTIQPYAQLHVPLPLIDTGSARVRFEIIGANEQILFTHEQAYTLKDNLNLITPPARLPIANLDTSDLWELRVSVGEKLLARHLFAWGEAPTEEVVTALEADGEISDEMRALLEEQAEQPLSLDDLLMQQEDDEQKQQGS